ncbi:3'-5' exonuclease [Methylonatrum kenyense]|uniref:3'-5' exonuclease n=1 Tax=Methylonatrum kenyense TaxID=455253 RepID=UPI0020C0385B|nr:3'-5' exonuclease [Methylonatrum kenyense]MCK8515992.1 3'-5' exonuclease [Methylonatrum kenyense]
MRLVSRRADPNTSWPAYLADRAARTRHPELAALYASWSGLQADMPIADVPLLAMDLETTGLDEQRHAIISIGLVPFDLRRILFSAHSHWLVRPPRPLEAKSVTLHGLTHDALARAPDLSDILPEVFRAMQGRLPVVHFRQIERPFLDAAVQARLGENLLFPVIDTMTIEGRWHRQTVWARLRAAFGAPEVSLRLHESRLRYGLPAYQPHHAAVDALATAELFQAQVARRLAPDTPVGRLWT